MQTVQLGGRSPHHLRPRCNQTLPGVSPSLGPDSSHLLEAMKGARLSPKSLQANACRYPGAQRCSPLGAAGATSLYPGRCCKLQFPPQLQALGSPSPASSPLHGSCLRPPPPRGSARLQGPASAGKPVLLPMGSGLQGPSSAMSPALSAAREHHQSGSSVVEGGPGCSSGGKCSNPAPLVGGRQNPTLPGPGCPSVGAGGAPASPGHWCCPRARSSSGCTPGLIQPGKASAACVYGQCK